MASSAITCRLAQKHVWPTAGFTTTTTGSRPVETNQVNNHGDCVGFPTSGETITSNTWRRIPTATAALEGAGCRSKSRSYRWGRKHKLRSDPVFCRETEGYQPAISRPYGFLSADFVRWPVLLDGMNGLVQTDKHEITDNWVSLIHAWRWSDVLRQKDQLAALTQSRIDLRCSWLGTLPTNIWVRRKHVQRQRLVGASNRRR